jgi:hypothetical protein
MVSHSVSPDRIKPISIGHLSIIPDDQISNDNCVEPNDYEEAPNIDNNNDDADKQYSAASEQDDSPGQDDIFSIITKDNQKETLQSNWMILNLLFHTQAEWQMERTRILTELDHNQSTDRLDNAGYKSELCGVIDEVKYSGRVNELDFFLPS